MDRHSSRLVFDHLKPLFAPYAEGLEIVKDTTEELYLDTRFRMKNGKPLFFGAVKTGKAYVSFHLMPVYVFPELLNGMSAELKKRMQGKSCFNFTRPDPVLFAELKTLTHRAHARYQEAGYLP